MLKVLCKICKKEFYAKPFWIKRGYGNWKDGNSTYRNLLKRTGAPQVCGLCKTEDTRVLAVLVHHDPKESKRFEENLLR